ncbi:hypothetical protein ASE30_03130 [Achromobacter sp. Root83]|nr:hypothetical protein ASE30_03130 [Achromobacter sp. Root83]
MTVSEAQRLKELEQENNKLMKLLAEYRRVEKMKARCPNLDSLSDQFCENLGWKFWLLDRISEGFL